MQVLREPSEPHSNGCPSCERLCSIFANRSSGSWETDEEMEGSTFTRMVRQVDHDDCKRGMTPQCARGRLPKEAIAS